MNTFRPALLLLFTAIAICCNSTLSAASVVNSRFAQKPGFEMTPFSCLKRCHLMQIRNYSTDTVPFPASWAGNWTGTLNLYYANGKTQSVAMTVEIHPIDTSKEGRYTFGLVYGSKEQDWRPYELVPVNPAKGIWKVDEKNSIVMESFLCGPKLLCWFVVQNSRILCTYEKISDTEMIFEVCSGQEKAVSTTGNTKQGEEDIPEVLTYPVSVFQRAVLKRG